MNIPLFEYLPPIGEDRRGAARPTDPFTSQAAARNIRTGSQRWKVLELLAGRGEDGATDYEIAVALNLLRGSAAKRRGELADLGLVAATDRTRFTDTGHIALVHVITKTGITAWQHTKENP